MNIYVTVILLIHSFQVFGYVLERHRITKRNPQFNDPFVIKSAQQVSPEITVVDVVVQPQPGRTQNYQRPYNQNQYYQNQQVYQGGMMPVRIPGNRQPNIEIIEIQDPSQLPNYFQNNGVPKGNNGGNTYEIVEIVDNNRRQPNYGNGGQRYPNQQNNYPQGNYNNYYNHNNRGERPNNPYQPQRPYNPNGHNQHRPRRPQHKHSSTYYDSDEDEDKYIFDAQDHKGINNTNTNRPNSPNNDHSSENLRNPTSSIVGYTKDRFPVIHLLKNEIRR